MQARTPGTLKNSQVTEGLRKSWSYVEANECENALFMFRNMFKQKPHYTKYYAFNKDEWNKISYADYNGIHGDQINNSWFILFRDTFYANENVLMQPKLYCNIPNCIMRVINNDNYKQIPKVFNKISPYTYSKNKVGKLFYLDSLLK